jgi:alcohol dehydrogenase (cytochrome c)
VFSNGVDICATQLVEEATFTPYSAAAAQCFGLWLGVQPCFSFGTPSSSKSGWVTALDASSGAVRWQYHAATPMIAGVTVTASGLVLTGDLNGNVLVLDAASGRILKSLSTGEPIGGGVISYATGGKQYVAVAAGIASKLLWTPTQPNGPSSIVVLGL